MRLVSQKIWCSTSTCRIDCRALKELENVYSSKILIGFQFGIRIVSKYKPKNIFWYYLLYLSPFVRLFLRKKKNLVSGIRFSKAHFDQFHEITFNENWQFIPAVNHFICIANIDKKSNERYWYKTLLLLFLIKLDYLSKWMANWSIKWFLVIIIFPLNVYKFLKQRNVNLCLSYIMR